MEYSANIYEATDIIIINQWLMEYVLYMGHPVCPIWIRKSYIIQLLINVFISILGKGASMSLRANECELRFASPDFLGKKVIGVLSLSDLSVSRWM